MNISSKQSIQGILFLLVGLPLAFFIATNTQTLLSSSLEFIRPVHASGAVPSGLGWHTLPNTTLNSVCAVYNGFPTVGGVGSSCKGVTIAWNSAVFDSARNRLVIFGGGHTDYYGNEVYALDLDTLTMERLTDPAEPAAAGACPDTLAGGTQTNSVHTYDAIEYIPSIDKMYLFGGAKSRCGAFSRLTWYFNMQTNSWEAVTPTGPIPAGGPGLATAYDPTTGLLFLHDTTHLYTFDPSTNTYVKRSPYYYKDFRVTASIDVDARRFVMVGNNRIISYDIGSGSNYNVTLHATSGAPAALATNSPGFEYDPISGDIILWSGGSSVHRYDVATNGWTTVSDFTGGPATAFTQGTFGRFRYSPADNVFVYYGDVAQDAYILRLNNGGTPPPPDTEDPVVALTFPVSSSTATGTVPLTATASDNVAVVGVQFFVNGVAEGAEDTTNPYSTLWDTTLLTDGVYTITAQARDAAGNITTSDPVDVTVHNSVPCTP